MGNEIVNQSGDNNHCRCPVCEQEKQAVAVLAPWISPAGQLVCLYGVCKSCGDRVGRQTGAEQTKVMDLVERNLLARYPFLRAKLPAGYEP